MTTKNHYALALLIVLSTILTGCKTGINAKSTSAPLLPLKNQHEIIRLDDGYVKAAMRDYLIYHNAPLFSHYDFTRKDLNNDGLTDGLVYLKTPYGHWCNIHGCTLLILKGHTNGFSIIGDIKSVRPPFSISKEKTAGWQNIDIHISGKREDAHTAQLFFDGKTYSMRTPNAPDTHFQNLKEDRIFP